MLSPVESALGRVMAAYSLMFDDARTAKARPKVEKYLRTLESAGETDAERLAVFGLAYLRQDDPLRGGYSGL